MIPVVLIVDDNCADMELIILAFEEAGMDAFIATAQDAVAAMEQLARRRPDLVLLDINMPKTDGFELLSSLRGNREFAGVEVIMMSSSNSINDQLRAHRLGVLRYWVKPARFVEWVTLVGTLPTLSTTFGGSAGYPDHDGVQATRHTAS